MKTRVLFFAFFLNSLWAVAQTKVLVFFSETCPICQYYAAELRAWPQNFQSDSIKFILAFPNRHSKAERIENFIKKYRLNWSVVQGDSARALVRLCSAEKTPEVVVLNTENTLLYRGRIDESYADLGVRRSVVRKREVYQALQSGQISVSSFPNPWPKAVGCYIEP